MKKTIAFVLVIAIIILVFVFHSMKANKDIYVPNNSLSSSQVNNAFDELYNSLSSPNYTYLDFLKDNSAKINYALSDSTAVLESPALQSGSGYGFPNTDLAYNASAEYTVKIATSGLYYLMLDYKPSSDAMSDITLTIEINGSFEYSDSKTIDIPLNWQDQSKDFQPDRYGDQTLPQEEMIGGWSTVYLYNNTYSTVEPLLFSLPAGTNTITITNISNDDFTVGNLEVKAPKEIPSYSDYIADKPMIRQSYMEFINATSYTEKNSSYVRLTAYNSPSLTPYNPVYQKLNVIDGSSWNTGGQSVTYQFTVPQDGRYNLAFHYLNDKADFDVFRTIYIDGQIPFAEMENYALPPTGTSKWENITLSSSAGLPYDFYLTKGTHSMTITADDQVVSNAMNDVQLMINQINQFDLEITKVTGKTVDVNRTWELTQYIPETAQYLQSYQILIENIINELSPYAPNKEKSSTLAYLQQALFQLKKISENPDKLPLYLANLSGGTGSVTQMLGDTLSELGNQGLYLDGIYVYQDATLKSPNASFLVNAVDHIKTFLASFTSSKYNQDNNPAELQIWVDRPITYVDLMQKMADTEFTPETGIKVQFSVMSDPNKLIYASAAHQNPDIALGLPSNMPYDLAVRGALYDMSSLPGYWNFANNFPPGAFIPYIYNGQSYAIPETIDFNTLIYRTDTFQELNIPVPNTWNDVINILPTLQRYGMNFYYPIAGGSSTKWFYQTSSLVYQYGGTLYSSDGLQTEINSPQDTEAFTFLNNLFTLYSLPEQVPSFYNSFRYNLLPVGITDLNTYLQIKNAAPEIEGDWTLAPNIGVKQPDGSVSRWYIENGSAGVIMNSGNQTKINQSWEFMQWWLGAQTQTNFAFNLQSTYGPAYVWLSANLDAAKNAPIDKKDLDVILNDVQWLRDVPRTPGQYMLERGISNVWNEAVFDGTPTKIALDNETLTINSEIQKRMYEFGYVDKNGNVIQPYTIEGIPWIEQQMKNAKE